MEAPEMERRREAGKDESEGDESSAKSEDPHP